jgi:hypothetical protein
MSIEKEKKWLEHELALIRATVAGTLIGHCLVLGIEDTEATYRVIDKAMDLIEKDVMRIYKHAKKQGALLAK